MAECLFIQLAVALWRHRTPIDCNQIPARSRFGHVLAYLRHHCTADVNIEEIAHRSGYSVRAFARIFREVTGTTPHNYLAQLRIGHAKRAMRKALRPQDLAGLVGDDVGPEHVDIERAPPLLVGVCAQLVRSVDQALDGAQPNASCGHICSTAPGDPRARSVWRRTAPPPSKSRRRRSRR